MNLVDHRVIAVHRVHQEHLAYLGLVDLLVEVGNLELVVKLDHKDIKAI